MIVTAKIGNKEEPDGWEESFDWPDVTSKEEALSKINTTIREFNDTRGPEETERILVELISVTESSMEKCPYCGMKYDTKKYEVVECDECGEEKSTFCCIPGGEGSLCIDCEIDLNEEESEYEDDDYEDDEED